MSLLPSSVAPDVFNHALGLNDRESVLKLQNGFIPFACNILADNDTWDRRAGRDMVYLVPDQPVLGIGLLTWDDGTIIEIAQFGSTMYDMTFLFTYYMDGGRVIIQSPDGSYWSIFDTTLGVIAPLSVAAPSATPQAANFTVANGESFGFEVSATQAVGLLCDQDHIGWYLQGYGASIGSTVYSTDLVFTIASGFSFRKVDYSGNTWAYSMTDGGNLIVTTV
jgi:hypothetical protein